MPRPSAREQIVQAGLKCLVEKSFNGVGVQDITATAGVPKGSFYNHFESKEALGAEIVERYGADMRRRELLSNKSIPPLERLRRHYDRSIRYLSTPNSNVTASSAISAPNCQIRAMSFATACGDSTSAGPRTLRRPSPRLRHKARSRTN